MEDEKKIATIDLGGNSILLVESKKCDISTLIKEQRAALVTRPDGVAVFIHSNDENTKIQIFENIVEAKKELSINPIMAALENDPKTPTYIFDKDSLLRILHINEVIIEDLISISIEYEDFVDSDELLSTVLKIARVYSVEYILAKLLTFTRNEVGNLVAMDSPISYFKYLVSDDDFQDESFDDEEAYGFEEVHVMDSGFTFRAIKSEDDNEDDDEDDDYWSDEGY